MDEMFTNLFLDPHGIYWIYDAQLVVVLAMISYLVRQLYCLTHRQSE